MDAILIAVAFFFGLIAQQFKLPPLVGFLISGFVLKFVLEWMGLESGAALSTIANLGVTLMLFSIGVKLRVRTLARPEIWGGTSLHTLIVLLIFTPVLVGAGALAGQAFGLSWQTALILSFALSFSSTVFAVKSLEENSAMGAMHGRIAIGLLIMQDILAVLFLTFSTGKIPSLWSLALLAGLLLSRKWLGALISKSGHGELVTLCGLFLALFLGAKGFETVGLKADLGALFIGVLVGYHPKAKEMSKSLLNITDLLLVGFFLQIGLEGSLTWSGAFWALLLLFLLPIKSIAFYGLLTRFHLRARTSWMSALTLSTYSEFGLIVMSIGVLNEWIPADWVVAMAIALSLSICVAAPLNRRSEAMYDRIHKFLQRFETEGSHPDDLPIQTRGERIAIFGMGRVGMAAYASLSERFPGKVIGFDRDPASVERHQQAERNVLLADATDSDFWERVRVKDNLDLVVLAMPKHTANLHAAEALRRHEFQGVVAATGTFDDEVRRLRELGLDTAFNLYSQAGAGFANHVYNVFKQQRPDLVHGWSQTGI
ncbi:MAG: cation:proton antiporter family protein [Verrucomicrobiota bacterium]